MSVLLECRNLTKRFGGVEAVSNLTFTMGSGRIIGLLGPNGSGKTTLIKMINGLLTPTKGEIYIMGEKPGAATHGMVSYLPDKNYLNKRQKVYQILDFFADFYADFNRRKAEAMLADLQIDSRMSLKSMSKGTLEKLQLILVMSREARLYVLDEPIAGVDPAARDYILRTIISNYNPEATVLISTHLIADIEQVLDDVIFIKQGRIELFAPVDMIREKEGRSVDALFREVFRC
ncbi:MAG: ABC transporter ATP-binding protein [Lachnospiraceae bacterium]|nr:ABC transporter ATP-binding protein [Lachnospiraceae bacterium]MDY4970243.1 ABC transporter ATP-binding protein [Lachnospiraceae bacterium]